MWSLTLPTEIRGSKPSSQTELLPSTWIWVPTRRMKRPGTCGLKSCVAAKGGFLGTKAPCNCHIDKALRKIHSDHVENSCSRQAVVCFPFERYYPLCVSARPQFIRFSAMTSDTLFDNSLALATFPEALVLDFFFNRCLTRGVIQGGSLEDKVIVLMGKNLFITESRDSFSVLVALSTSWAFKTRVQS